MGYRKTTDRCEEIRELLFPYLKSQISGFQVYSVEEHLQSCAVCRNELTLLREMQRLEDSGRQGAIDPASFIVNLNSVPDRVRDNIPTVQGVIREIEKTCVEEYPDIEEKSRRILLILHDFLVRTRSFLQSRSQVRAGKEWIKLEKRRAALLKQVLNHPCIRFLHDVIRVQADAYVSRGLIFQLHGDTQSAESALSLSVVLHWALNDSDDNQTRRFLGELKFYEGDLNAAEYLFSESLRDHIPEPPEQALLLRNLGNIEYIRGNIGQCRNFLEQALAVSRNLGLPEYPARDLMNLSVIDFSRGEIEAAVNRCREALDLLDGKANIHLKGQLHANLGTFLSVLVPDERSRGHWQRALEFFRKGFFLKDETQVIRNIALDDYQQGRLDRALTQLSDAEARYPENDALRCQLQILIARILRLTGRFPEALDVAVKATNSAEKLNETMLLDAAILEQLFIALREERTSDIPSLAARCSASKKTKPDGMPSMFDLENESLLVEVFRTLGDRSAATRCFRRLKRMLRKIRRSHPESSSGQRNASGEAWEDVLRRLDPKQ